MTLHGDEDSSEVPVFEVAAGITLHDRVFDDARVNKDFHMTKEVVSRLNARRVQKLTGLHKTCELASFNLFENLSHNIPISFHVYLQ